MQSRASSLPVIMSQRTCCVSRLKSFHADNKFLSKSSETIVNYGLLNLLAKLVGEIRAKFNIRALNRD